MKSKKARIIICVIVGFLLLGALAVTWWIKRFHRYTPIEVVQDVRAGIAARHDPQPVVRFLEIRYGPLSDPANRQKAFLDFFNVGHVEGLRLLVAHMEPDEKRTNITAMAQWVAHYRRTMSPAEKAVLGARFKTPSGAAMLQRATAQYLAQDVRYRAETAPVITELMTTIAAVQNQ